MLGYSSYMTLIPQKNIGIFVVHHHESTSLSKKAVALVVDFLGKRTAVDSNPQKLQTDLSIFEGTYRWTTYCHTCPNGHQPKAKKLIANEDHTLSGFGRRFYQVKPLLFKSFDGQRTMGFLKNKKGEIEFMSLGNINTFEKVD